MLQNAYMYLLANIRFDAAENEPAKKLQNFQILKKKHNLLLVILLILLTLRTAYYARTGGAQRRPGRPGGAQRRPGRPGAQGHARETPLRRCGPPNASWGARSTYPEGNEKARRQEEAT